MIYRRVCTVIKVRTPPAELPPEGIVGSKVDSVSWSRVSDPLDEVFRIPRFPILSFTLLATRDSPSIVSLYFVVVSV